MVSTLTKIELPIRSNVTKTGFEGGARIVNGYVEELGPDAKQGFAIYSAPGFTDFATLSGAGKVRAMLPIAAKLYNVCGRVVSYVDPSGTESTLGGFATDDPAYMDRNRRNPPQIGIVSGGLYKTIDTGTDSLSDINIAGLQPPFSFAVVDSYGILPGPGDVWTITSNTDFTSIDLLDFASVESDPDANRRVIAYNNAAWFLGEETTELWANEGGSFPFARLTATQVGCLAAGTAAIADDKLIWVADDRTVKLTSGNSAPVTISNPGVSRAIEAEPNQSDMVATTFAFQGHHFYVLSGSTFSYQYDVTTQSWTERKSYGLSRWRIDKAVEFGGETVFGDYANGKLYKMGAGYYDEAGTAMVTEIHLPPVTAHPAGLIIDTLYFDVVPGVGLNTTNAANKDPEVMLHWSDDGSRTWKGGITKKLGKIGETQTRVKFDRLGSIRRGQQRTFRISYSADTQFGVFGATAMVEPLAA